MEMEEWKKRQTDKISNMGLFEAKAYKQVVINSLADNHTKFFLYDLLDSRIASLDLENRLEGK